MTDRINKAQEKKTKKPILTMEEAWKAIGQMKNTDAQKAKLREVFNAFQDGKIGREPESAHKTFTKSEALRLWTVLQEQVRAERLAEIVEQTPDNYELVTELVQVADMINILENEDFIPIDTETTGLNLYGRDKIVGVSFSAMKADRHFYIPVMHDELVLSEKMYNYMKEGIKTVLSMKQDKVFHNAIFDLHQFRSWGLEVYGRIFCTQELMKVLNENEMSYMLKVLAPKYLKVEADTFESLFGKGGFQGVELKYARYYACKDTHLTGKLFQFQMENLKKMPRLYDYYMTVEQPLLRVVFEMEREGMCVDLPVADKVSEKLSAQVADLRNELINILGDINLDSPQQLLPALQRKVSPKLESTAKDELKKYKFNPIVGQLLKYRELHKLNKDFLSKVREFIQPDGKVHGNFNPNGARTGRFSATQPNLQQIPPDARIMYVAEEGSLILSMDFGAQEPRMLAHYSQEQPLIDCFVQGRDLYATYASEFYNKPYEQCYKNPDGSDTKERKTFKVVNLAVMYSMGAGSLGDLLGISSKEAQAILTKFATQFPKVAEFGKRNTIEACSQGFVEMEIEYKGRKLARKRRLPFFKGQKPSNTYDTYSTNAKIQGTSAIQTKLCMIEGNQLCKELSTNERRFAILACVHDELLFKVPKDITQEELNRLESIMTDTIKLTNVPSTTDSELGVSWGNLKSRKVFFQ